MLYTFDTVSISIQAKPEKVWEFIADITNWKLFSDFGKNIEQINGVEWIAHTSQGDIRVIPKFDRDRLLLDQVCILASGEEQYIPYRVVPNGDGCELIMSNFKGSTSSDDEYAEQMHWLKQELLTIKELLEV